MPQTLKTDRLVLRPYETADADRLAALISAPAVQRWLPTVPHPYTRADAVAFIGRAKETMWKCAVTREGDLIGGIAIADELGYWLGQPFWGHGYATEVCQSLLSAWFDGGQERDLRSGHVEGNHASRNVLLKLGFTDTHKGETDSHFLGHPVALQHMALSAADWNAGS